MIHARSTQDPRSRCSQKLWGLRRSEVLRGSISLTQRDPRNSNFGLLLRLISHSKVRAAIHARSTRDPRRT